MSIATDTRARGSQQLSFVAFALTTFVSAGLLFQVQPMVGRVLLPLLGGTPFVWITCLALFQLTLLFGYAFVHLLARRSPLRVQVLTTLGLSAIVVARGPLSLEPTFAHGTELAPAWAIARVFASQVAPAYFVLAATAPLFQHWYVALRARDPYRLYAVSNAGSFVGLLGYPLWVEPLLDLRDQQRLWSWGFSLYALLLAAIGLHVLVRSAADRESPEDAVPPRDAAPALSQAPGLAVMTWWVALSAVPSALLCAVSNHITVDIAAAPLLWVLPLALYLLSFVIVFGKPELARRPLYDVLWLVFAPALAVLLVPGRSASVAVMLGVPLGTLYLGSLLCHAELLGMRPDARGLTAYYLCMSLGGALGGLSVAVLAPLLFTEHHELQLSVMAVFVLLFLRARSRERAAPTLRPSFGQRVGWLGFGMALPLLAASLFVQARGVGRHERVLARSRNFFGPLRVAEESGMRVLRHGRTNHGMQFVDPARRREPVAYYGAESGVGRVLSASSGPRRLGVVGLGVGTLAAYGRAGDELRFYEVNPSMARLAREHFTYLADTEAKMSIVLGDGRLSLAHEAPQRYDVLVLDAFSSDAVPLHLLTVEAFATYLRQLAPEGLLLLNVSNRHLDVGRAAFGAARAHGLAGVLLDTPADAERGFTRVRWALFSRSARQLEPLLGPPARTERDLAPVTFTDRRASVLSILR